MSDLPRMVRVTAERRCPICGKPDYCLICPTGNACICARISKGSSKECGDAGWLHRNLKGRPVEVVEPRREPVKRSEWYGPALKYAHQITTGLKADLCRSLGLPEDALNCLSLLGSFPGEDGKPVYTFPEQDGAGNTIGLNRRYPDGEKKHIPGGGRGLTLPNGWDEDSPEPIFIVEGPTDTAAMVAAGLKAIGRPSNRGGAAFLAEALQRVHIFRKVFVVGENDRKSDGSWPGLDGCISVAGNLADKVKHEVRWVLAPTDYKDVREFLTSEQFAGVEWNKRGTELVSLLIEQSHPAKHMPAGYTPLIEEEKRKNDYDPDRWRE